MPGKADSLRSHGTNDLIKCGARLITDGDEIIDDLFGDGAHERKNSAMLPAHTSNHGGTEDDAVLSLVQAEPTYFEELTKATHIPPAEVYSALTRLEIAHKVKRVFGGGYVKGSSASCA